MTRHLARALIALYTVLAFGMWGLALYAWQEHEKGFAAACGAACLGFAVAILHQTIQRDELRHAHRQLDAVSRPLTTRQDQQVAEALDGACCDAWWTTLGANHECTRKDQTT